MPLNNFGWVGPGVYRSEQPDQYGIRTLGTLGITVILKLNHPDESPGIDETGPRLVLWEWPFDLEAPPDADTQRVVQQIGDYVAAGEVVLIHCTHGRDRTGFVAAAYQLLALKQPLAQVLDTRARYGVNDAVRRLFNQSFTAALERLSRL